MCVYLHDIYDCILYYNVNSFYRCRFVEIFNVFFLLLLTTFRRATIITVNKFNFWPLQISSHKTAYKKRNSTQNPLPDPYEDILRSTPEIENAIPFEKAYFIRFL